MLATLTPREEQICASASDREKSDYTLEEWGNVSPSRVAIRQIEAKALRKLRHPSRARSIESFVAVEVVGGLSEDRDVEGKEETWYRAATWSAATPVARDRARQAVGAISAQRSATVRVNGQEVVVVTKRSAAPAQADAPRLAHRRAP